jgi:hypothetical protein
MSPSKPEALFFGFPEPQRSRMTLAGLPPAMKYSGTSWAPQPLPQNGVAADGHTVKHDLIGTQGRYSIFGWSSV